MLFRSREYMESLRALAASEGAYCYTKKKKDLEFSIYKGRVARVKIFAKKEVGVYPAIIMTS